jgi:hypothetical protein
MGRPRGSKNRKTILRELGYAVAANTEPANTTFKRYMSVGELLDDTNGVRPVSDVMNSGWAGRYYTMHDAINYMQGGATHVEMKPALEIINKVDASFRDREVSAWQPSVCGAYPIVADYLMGLPESMRERKPQESDIAPIKLVIETSISSGVTERENMQRGAALAALVMRMAEMRPVELYFFYSGRFKKSNCTSSFMVKVDSTPVSLSHVVASFSLTFCRQIVLSLAHKLASAPVSEAIFWGYGAPSLDGVREKKLRELMGLVPPDIFIQGGYLPDAQLMGSDPVAWVHKQLEKQRAIDDML